MKEISAGRTAIEYLLLYCVILRSLIYALKAKLATLPGRSGHSGRYMRINRAPVGVINNQYGTKHGGGEFGNALLYLLI